MGKLMFRQVVVGGFAALALQTGFATVREIDFRYLYTTSSLPDGWTHQKLLKSSPTSDWKGGVYFESREGWLRSPVFDAAMRSVTIEVETSNANPERRLYLHPISRGIEGETGFPLVPTTNRNYVAQTFNLTDCAADQFVLKFADSGASGNWGMMRIEVCYGDESTDADVAPPRSWSLSSVVSAPRSADFSVLAFVTSGRPWKNGVSVEGFHAFSDSGSCETISHANAKSSYSGLYSVVVTNENGTLSYALSMLGTTGSGMRLMLPVELDAERRVGRLTVGYRVQELMNGEGKTSDLSFSYCALDDLTRMAAADVAWTPVSSAKWSTGDTNLVRRVEIPPRSVRTSKYVCFRWSVPKEGNSSVVGLSEVKVGAALQPSGFAISVR